MAAPAAGGAQPAGQPNVFQQAQQGQTAAMMGTAAGMGYQPAQVQAGQIAQTDLTQYFNPFESQVVNCRPISSRLQLSVPHHSVGHALRS